MIRYLNKSYLSQAQTRVRLNKTVIGKESTVIYIMQSGKSMVFSGL